MADRPHYHGHRERLRQRFAERGPDALADYELLELILARALPRQDVKPIAKDLLARFGSFAGVLGAPAAQLAEVKGVKARTALELKIAEAAGVRMLKGRIADRPAISSWSALVDYARTAMAAPDREEFHVLFLDKKNRLIADELQGRGTIDHAPVYPREVIKRALELGATAIVLVHNHPSGDPTPSRADVEMTRRVAEAGKPLGIVVHDHLVIGAQDVASLRTLGLMEDAAASSP